MSGVSSGGRSGHEDVDVQGDQFGRQLVQSVVVSASGAVFDMDGFALNPTEIAKSPEKFVDIRISRRSKEKTDSRDSLQLLSASRERPRHRSAAKALGVEISPVVLASADDLIE